MPEKTSRSKCGNPDVFLSISAISRETHGDSAPVTLQATRRIRKLLSGSNMIFRITSIVEAGVVLRLVEFLAYNYKSKLQFDSAWAITNKTSGTSADTPGVVIIPVLIKCVSSSETNVGSMAVWVLGTLAGDGPTLRDEVFKYRVVKPLIQVIDSFSLPETSLRTDVWGLARVCCSESPPLQFNEVKSFIPTLAKLLSHAGDGPTLQDEVIKYGVVNPLVQVIDSSSLPRAALRGLVTMCYDKRPLPPFDELTAFIPTLAKLLHQADKQVLNESCRAISYLTDGGNNRIADIVKVASIIPRLVRLLNHEDLGVTKAALSAIGKILTGTILQAQVVINCGSLPHLGELLDHPDVRVQKDAAWAISSVLAGTPDQIQAVFDNNLIDTIVRKICESPYMVKKWLVRSLTNLLSGGTVKQIFSTLRKYLIPWFRKFLSIEKAREENAAVTKISSQKNNPKEAGTNSLRTDMEVLMEAAENRLTEFPVHSSAT